MERTGHTFALAIAAGALTAGAASLLGCSRTTPEPGGGARASGSASASKVTAPSSSVVTSPADLVARLNAMGSLRPPLPPPPDPDSGPPQPQREPDWDLDPDDPWRDYVTRYVRATKRYGDATDCVVIGPAQGSGGKRNVTVRNNPGGSCGDATPKDDSVRDVFVVDVAGDRLAVDDPGLRAHLERWPEGSDPGGPAKVGVPEVENLLRAKSPLLDALHDMQLVTVRGQTYGRGTYLVVTLAGWHGPILRTMSASELAPTADRLCKANGQMPLGIFAGVDRSNMLRIRCGPDGAKPRWDRL